MTYAEYVNTRNTRFNRRMRSMKARRANKRRSRFMTGTIAFAMFAIGFLIAALCTGCAPYFRQLAKVGPRAYYGDVQTMTHVMCRPGRMPECAPESIRMVTVTNPTREGVIFTCATFRAHVPAMSETDFRLDDRDKHCDLQNENTYSPNTGVN